MSMYLITIVLIISTTLTTLTSSQLVATSSNTEIKSIEPRGIIKSPQCGGQGNLTSLDVSDCSEFPCRIKKDTVIVINFIPRVTMTSVNLKYTLTPKSGNPTIDSVAVPGPTLPAGSQSRVTMGSLADIFQKKDVTVKFELLNQNQVSEICVNINGGGKIFVNTIALIMSLLVVTFKWY